MTGHHVLLSCVISAHLPRIGLNEGSNVCGGSPDEWLENTAEDDPTGLTAGIDSLWDNALFFESQKTFPNV